MVLTNEEKKTNKQIANKKYYEENKLNSLNQKKQKITNVDFVTRSLVKMI
jgi:hypothetical protein